MRRAHERDFSRWTDVLPALGATREWLSRSACNEKKERLANSCLLVQAYGFLSILELLCALRL